MNDLVPGLLIEAAGRAEYDSDARWSGEPHDYRGWDLEPQLVKQLYLDRAEGWFQPVAAYLDEKGLRICLEEGVE